MHNFTKNSKTPLLFPDVNRTNCVWLLLLCLLWMPGISRAQATKTAKLTIHATGQPLKNILNRIGQQSSLNFSFSPEVGNISPVSLSVENRTPEEVMKELSKRYGLQFKTIGSMIAVTRSSAENRPAAPAPKKDPGKINGKIIDEDNGEPIADVSIRIGNTGTTSAIDGSFSLTLPRGKYEADISFVGYRKKLVTDIEIKDNQVFELNITLKREKGQLSAVVVKASARKESVASLYARQKNAAGITDGISAEQISRTPDKNIGESLKRVSGLSTMDNRFVVVRGLSERYNQAVLNGQQMPSTELNRKQFSFDIIPSGMVDNITVSKTITPDKSAEFGGGLVEVNTRDIPAENFISLSAGVSVNDRTAGKDMLSLERDGSKGYLGQYASHRYLFGQKDWSSLADIRAYQEAHADETILNNNWQPYYYTAQPSQNYQLSVGRVLTTNAEKQDRLGLLASVTYRNTQAIQGIATSRNGFSVGQDGRTSSMLSGDQHGFFTTIGGLVGIGYTTRKHKLSWQTIFTQLLDEQVNFGIGATEYIEGPARAFVEKVQQTNFWQSQLKGEHAIGGKGIRLQWVGSYTRIKRDRPDNHLLVWGAVPESFDLPYNEFTMADYYPAGNPGTASDPASLRMYSHTAENNFSWDANVQVPFSVGSTKNIFKTGYAGWYKDREFYVAMIGDHPGNYEAYPAVGELFSPKYGGGRSSVSTFGDDYNRVAGLHAVYGMLDNRITDRLRLVWGLRAEYFDMNKANQALDQVIGEINDSRNPDQQLDFSALYNREKNWHLFPSANLTYSLTPQINIRAAYAKSIIRPDLRELAWFREYDFELGGTYSSNLLRSSVLNNYDLRFEWYPDAGEILSASVFYKDIKYPMEIFKYASNNIYELRNNYKSHNYGVELEMRKSLSFINIGLLKHITLYGNVTALSSRVTPMEEEVNRVQDNVVVPELQIGQEEKRPLMGQSNYIANAGLYYDDNHLHISLTYNTLSNRMMIYEQDAANSRYERPMRSFDGQIAYRFLNQQAEVKLNISNILAESSIIYINQAKTPEESAEVQKGNYKTRYLLYDKGSDYLEQILTPGRTYGLTLSYTIK